MSDARDDLQLDVRPLVQKLGKPPADWQRRDLVDLCLTSGIRVVSFRYPSFDGKLRELRLPVTDRASLDRLLAAGERADGSSLFPGLFEVGASDLYVVPVYRHAFLDPWGADELHVVCRFAGRDGAPSPLTPDTVLAHTVGRLRQATGLELLALAELEHYLILDRGDDRFTGRAQRNYHQSEPFLHGRAIADEILRLAAALTGRVKYVHAEVGYIDRVASGEPELDGRRAEQFELELDLMPVEDLAAWLPVLRWMMRVAAHRHGASLTFVPKLDEGMAGSGMHLHLALTRDGRNIIHAADGGLSDEARRLVGGLLGHAAPLAAFGNTVASSYLRLVPGQEAPTRLSWGESHRGAMIRVPLSFATAERLDLPMNPGEAGRYPPNVARPTIEYRTPDGSAFPHLLLAAVTACIEDGLRSDEALAIARRTEIAAGAPEPALGGLEPLPTSAVAAARSLESHRTFFEERGFPARLLDLVARNLRNEADEDLTDRLRRLPAAERLAESRRLMHKDLHKH